MAKRNVKGLVTVSNGDSNNARVIKPNNDIKFHQAKRTVDQYGQVYKDDILEKITTNNIVRISMYVSKKSRFYGLYRLTHDTPYLRIIKIQERQILGEILDKFRYLAGDHYPLKTGSCVWIGKNQIIEVWCDGTLAKYKTNNYIAYTGPFETIDDYESSSDDDTDTDVSNETIDRSKIDARCIGE